MTRDDNLEAAIKETRAEMMQAAGQRLGRDQADDAVQEAVLMAFDADSEHYDVERQDKEYLMRLLNIVCERLRARRRRSREVPLEMLAETAAALPTVTLEEECCARLAASNITPIQRKIWTMRLTGMRVLEIAQQLCVTRQMIYAHMHASGPNLRLVNMDSVGFASAEALFSFCAHQFVYRAPTKTGSALGNERQAKIR